MTKLIIDLKKSVPKKTISALKTLITPVIMTFLNESQSNDFVTSVGQIFGEESISSLSSGGDVTFNVGFDDSDEEGFDEEKVEEAPVPDVPKKRKTRAKTGKTVAAKNDPPEPLDSESYKNKKKREQNEFVASLCKILGWAKGADEQQPKKSLSEIEESFVEDFKGWMSNGLENAKGKHVTTLGPLKPAIRDKIDNDGLVDIFMSTYAKFVSSSVGKEEVASPAPVKKSQKSVEEKFAVADYSDRMDKLDVSGGEESDSPTEKTDMTNYVSDTLKATFGDGIGSMEWDSEESSE